MNVLQVLLTQTTDGQVLVVLIFRSMSCTVMSIRDRTQRYTYSPQPNLFRKHHLDRAAIHSTFDECCIVIYECGSADEVLSTSMSTVAVLVQTALFESFHCNACRVQASIFRPRRRVCPGENDWKHLPSGIDMDIHVVARGNTKNLRTTLTSLAHACYPKVM